MFRLRPFVPIIATGYRNPAISSLIRRKQPAPGGGSAATAIDIHHIAISRNRLTFNTWRADVSKER
jgi:hypothetical protein